MQDLLRDPDFRAGIAERFAELDADGNGRLDGPELLPALRELMPQRGDDGAGAAPPPLADGVLRRAMRTFDADGDGCLDGREFFDLVRCLALLSAGGLGERSIALLEDGAEALADRRKAVQNVVEVVRRNLAAAPRILPGLAPGLAELLASEAWRGDITASYRELDRDGDGRLDATELRPLLAQVAKVSAAAITDDHCCALLAVLDEDGDGVVSLDEYMQLAIAGICVTNAPPDFRY